MFGYTAAEADRPVDHAHHPGRTAHRRGARAVADPRGAAAVDHFETLRQRKDGTLMPISLTISPILDHDGRVIGASKIARDISDRRRAEAALADSRGPAGRSAAATGGAGGGIRHAFRFAENARRPAGACRLGRTLLRADGNAVWLTRSAGEAVASSAPPTAFRTHSPACSSSRSAARTRAPSRSPSRWWSPRSPTRRCSRIARGRSVRKGSNR